MFSDDTKYQKGSFLKIYSYLHFINRDCINNKYNEKKLVPPAHISLANVWHKNSTFYLGVLTSLRPMRGENSDPEPIRAECLRRHHFHPLMSGVQDITPASPAWPLLSVFNVSSEPGIKIEQNGFKAECFSLL